MLGFAVAAALALAGTTPARAEAQLLIEAATGKVLHAENATYPWYPASVTKLMTAYTTLRAIKEGRMGFDTMLTVSRNAAAQQPTKMGFKAGTRLTLERVPEGRNDWAPHERSMKLGNLANLCATMPSWIDIIINTEELDINPPGGGRPRPPLPETRKELVAAFDDAWLLLGGLVLLSMLVLLVRAPSRSGSSA